MVSGMWRVEECEVECVRMDGEMMGIYTIYIFIFFFITLSAISGASRTVD